MLILFISLIELKFEIILFNFIGPLVLLALSLLVNSFLILFILFIFEFESLLKFEFKFVEIFVCTVYS